MLVEIIFKLLEGFKCILTLIFFNHFANIYVSAKSGGHIQLVYMSRKKGSFLPVLFKRLFFLVDLSRKKVFQSVKSPYFCVGQQKKKELLKKKLVKRTAISGHVNRLIIALNSTKNTSKAFIRASILCAVL